MRASLLIYFAFSFAVSSVHAMPRKEVIQICDDAGEWPPFTYAKRVEGTPSKQVEGYSVDVISTIFKRHHIAYKIELLPWKRCLYNVEHGGPHVMLLSASYSDERDKKFLFSEPYYTITPHYFYNREVFVDAPIVRSKEDLRNYKVGGMLGYNYGYWGLSPSDVETKGIYSYENLVGQLRLQRIDLFVENLEVIAGFEKLGKPLLKYPEISYEPVPGMASTPFFMLFSKSETGVFLQKLINEDIRHMRETGELEVLRQKHLQ